MCQWWSGCGGGDIQVASVLARSRLFRARTRLIRRRRLRSQSQWRWGRSWRRNCGSTTGPTPRILCSWPSRGRSMTTPRAGLMFTGTVLMNVPKRVEKRNVRDSEV